jgi:drug/metabolite transporter (DMT)-like permease
MSVKNFALIKLLIAAIIWGLSFSLIRMTLDSFSTAQLLFWRFLFAFIIAEVLLFVFNPKMFKESKSDIKTAFWTGSTLGISLLFQIHGLNFTTATNSAFITATYVVMIPFFAYLFFKQKVKIIDIALAFVALIGMVLLLDILSGSSFSIANMNYGDLLTLASAATAALQIMLIGVFAKTCVSPFRFNTYQIFWSLVATAPYMIYEWKTKGTTIMPVHITTQAWVGIISLILFVSILAFYLQVSAQKHLNTATASMLCLLEAPFSFIFATFLLSESVNWLQGLGAVIIITSAFLSVYFDKPKLAHSAVG